MSRIQVAPVVVLGLLLLPTAVFAQSSITGRVVDNTEGVLPGVTVEASSPVLIGGSRVFVTDGQGQFTFIDLEPGIYSVTFQLPGFGTLIRDGIDLPGDFTATINATLTVGALEETVTVSGESPLVDVQQSQRTQVLTRDVLDSLPTGRNTWTQAQMLAGVRMTGNDVGGSQYVSDLLLESHGASSLHSTYEIDGMKVNSMLNDGRDQNYYQDQTSQEITIQTSGGLAETSSGGIRLNMIPKDGGNTFAGTAYAGGTAGAWQSDNLTQDLVTRGLNNVDTIARIFDYNATVGGPILRDRLWFYTSWRLWGVWDPPANTFLDNGDRFIPERQIWSPILRITAQLTGNTKFGAHFDRQGKSSGPTLEAVYPDIGWIPVNSPGFDQFITNIGVTDPETARGRQSDATPYGVVQGKFTSAISSRLLFEGGYSMSRTYVLGLPPNNVTVPIGNSLDLAPIDQTTLWYARVRKNDRDTGTFWNATRGSRQQPIRHTFSSSISYVTGSHNLKVGFQRGSGSRRQYRGTDQNGHFDRISYRSGVPDSVRITNSPTFVNPRLNYDLGIYVQDAWTRDRLTVNGGIRFEWLNSGIGVQDIQAGRFVPARSFTPTENVPNWSDVQPRFGLAYDLFGDGRTALKFSLGTYSTPHGVGFAEQFNAMDNSDTATLPWGDSDIGGAVLSTNGDDIVQDNELDFTRIPTGFGTNPLDRFDPDIERETNLEFGVNVQHQLMDGVSINLGYFRRQFFDQYSISNILRASSDYRSVAVVSPLNGEQFTAFDLIDASSIAQVDNLQTNADGSLKSELYNGFEVSLQARLPGGGTIISSTTTQRILRKTCDEGIDDPNLNRFCDRGNIPSPFDGPPFLSDFKFAITYPVPYGVNLSLGFNSTPGRGQGDLIRVDEQLPTNWLITRSTTNADGTLVIPDMVLSSITIPLAPAGVFRRLDRVNQVDIGIRKTFRTGTVSYEGAFEVFNMLNASTVQSIRSNNFGTSSYDIPSRVLLGRMPRLSMLVRW
jgi:hypothetical protein